MPVSFVLAQTLGCRVSLVVPDGDLVLLVLQSLPWWDTSHNTSGTVHVNDGTMERKELRTPYCNQNGRREQTHAHIVERTYRATKKDQTHVTEITTDTGTATCHCTLTGPEPDPGAAGLILQLFGMHAINPLLGRR